MNLRRLFNSSTGKIIVSIVLGLGLASLFYKVCKDKSCIHFSGPVINKVDGKIFEYGNKCYKYDSVAAPCDANRKTLSFSEGLENPTKTPTAAPIRVTTAPPATTTPPAHNDEGEEEEEYEEDTEEATSAPTEKPTTRPTPTKTKKTNTPTPMNPTKLPTTPYTSGPTPTIFPTAIPTSRITSAPTPTSALTITPGPTPYTVKSTK